MVNPMLSHKIVSSLPKSVLIQLIENFHHFHFWEQYLANFCYVQRNPDYSLIQSGFKSSGLNGIYNINFDSSTVEERIQSIINYFKENDLPFSWIVGNCSKPTDLKSLLAQYGFDHWHEQFGMAFDLYNLPIVPKFPFQSKIVKVTSLELRDLFAKVSIKGFGLDSTSANVIYDHYQINCIQPYTILFLGFHLNTPVATSLIVFHDGIGSIFNVTVIPEFRREGWGTALINNALLEAKQLGFRYITVQASDEGRLLNKSIGFREYTKIRRYFSI